MNGDVLLTDVEDGVAVLTLNRPEALNALNARLRGALVAALDALDRDEAVGCIVLTGRGRAFSAGLDLKEMGASGRDVTAEVEDGDLGAALARTGTPVIAAVNGLAVTGGFEITLACDMALAAVTAWFQDTHAKLGLTPGWGLSQRLPRAVGLARAKEISLSARRVPAAEAAALGLVNRVVPEAELMAEAVALARSVAQWDRTHIRRMKALMDRGWAMPLGDALSFEAAEARRENAILLNARF